MTVKQLTKELIRSVSGHQVSKAGLLKAISPSYAARKKYREENLYWQDELANLRKWFIEKSSDWYGIEPPNDEQELNTSEIWSTNAINTLHKLRPSYFEELKLEADAFRGLRVLEVGCGPLAPVLQFTDCERHGVDPLISRYVEAGWPLFDLDVTFVNAFGEALPYPDDYFDVLISVNALDHVDNFEKVASEMQRVLRPGGRIYIEVEYHTPTATEPLQLDDQIIIKSFSLIHMNKISERGKLEMFEAMALRFGLSFEKIKSRFSSLTNEECFVIWHGQKSSA